MTFELWVTFESWVTFELWVTFESWVTFKLWLTFQLRGGDKHTNKQKDNTHINTMALPGPEARPSKNYTNTKHLNAEIQMTYM